MGPPLLSGGDVVGNAAYHLEQAASMGPPLLSGGDLRDGQVTMLEVKLQWGRRFSAAETYQRTMGTRIGR